MYYYQITRTLTRQAPKGIVNVELIMTMTQDDRQKYRALYVQTAQGYTTDLHRNIALLLTNSEDQNALNVAHLAAHSLASQSLMMNYHSLGELSQLIEQLLQSAKDKESTLKNGVLLVIDNTLKQMVVSLYEIEKNDKEIDLSGEVARLKEVAGVD